ncbi:SDR family NAD(P)-dependent oxidoreductase [Curvivirga sp.]|uniref:SDR family NAD(P)-dependent oxidoreductase n=1 Tax=Curvivirga sp. TaxID=2856848 RepID=UPI003B58D6E8
MRIQQFDLDRYSNPSEWQDHCFGLSADEVGEIARMTICVTGAATGYGLEISRVLSVLGATVILLSRRLSKLEAAKALLMSEGGDEHRIFIAPVDLTKEKQVTDYLCRFLSEYGEIHGWVNNAALPCKSPGRNQSPMLTLELEDWQSIMQTNVTAPWYASRELIRLHKPGNKLRIVNFSSLAGWSYKGGVGPYNVSKAALNNMTMSMAHETAMKMPDEDIQMNVLIPTEAKSEMNQGSEESPLKIIPMLLKLLAQGFDGPNGYFFHHNGASYRFTDRLPYAAGL